MGIKEWFIGKKEEYAPSVSSSINLNLLTEKFKGEVEQNNIKFPQELGEEHPFNFAELEQLYKKFGFFTAVVDKYVDFVVGQGFYIECKDERAKEIIEQFMKDVQFDTIVRAWCKEALIKGNGFLEIGGSKKEGVKGLKVLNANYMYVERDNKGKILGYNQYTGAFKKFDIKKIIPFSENEICHVPFNRVGDCAYGLGIGYSALKLVDNLLASSNDLHVLTKRKANSPIHAKLGKVEGDLKIIPRPEDVAAFGEKLENLNNKHEWATDALVDLKVLDFGNVGDKFNAVLEYDLNMLIYAFQIPPELLGIANIPEGLAVVRMDAFQRRIQSIQAELEKVIESQIFKRVLNANGLEADVEFEWGEPNVSATANRLTLVSELVKSPMLSNPLKELLEKELVNLLGFDYSEYEKLRDNAVEIEKQRELERPQPIVPGQNQKFPQKPQPKQEQPKQPKAEELLKSFIDVMIKLEEKKNEQLINLQKEKQENNKEEIITTTKLIEDIDKIKQEKQEIENKIKELEEKNKEEKEKYEKQLASLIQKEQPIKKSKIKKKRESIIPKLNKVKIPFIKDEAYKENKEEIQTREYVKKVDGEWCVFSHQTGKKFGCYATKAQADKRLAQVKKFSENYEYIKSCQHCTEKWDSVNDVEEWLGFSYKKFLKQIENTLKVYSFEQIMALTEAEATAGYLTATQIEGVREALDIGFKKGLGIREIAKLMDKKVDFKDLYRMTEDGNVKLGASGLPILSKSADRRALDISRTETTRFANLGAEEYYKENGVDKVTWIAAFSDRTCPDCEALNGQIYNIGEHPDIPLHPLCRCMLSPVVELK